MEIHAGTGGEDSKIFVHELFAAYAKFAASNGLKVEILDSRHGQVAAMITGKNAGGLYQHESGQHCIQRVPPTERNGRRQTSLVMVAVLPMPPKHETKLLPLSEIETTTMRGTGPGGQHKNKTDSCVRMVHIPTRATVVIDSRDQHSNRKEAHRVLSAKVLEARRLATQGDYDKMRRQKMGSGGRGEKIRTYNFIDSRAVDHRTGTKTKAVQDVIGKGRFDLLLGDGHE